MVACRGGAHPGHRIGRDFSECIQSSEEETEQGICTRNISPAHTICMLAGLDGSRESVTPTHHNHQHHHRDFGVLHLTHTAVTHGVFGSIIGISYRALDNFHAFSIHHMHSHDIYDPWNDHNHLHPSSTHGCCIRVHGTLFFDSVFVLLDFSISLLHQDERPEH
jgi:hypothetical protein